MKIIEADFKIEHDGESFLLSFKKAKKDLKDAPKIPYKPPLYHRTLKGAIMSVYRWRKHKKYAFTEVPETLLEPLKELNKVLEAIAVYANPLEPYMKQLEKLFCKDMLKPIVKVKKPRAKSKTAEKKFKYEYTERDYMIEIPKEIENNE